MNNSAIEKIIFNGREVRMAIMPGFSRYGILEIGEVVYRDTLKICPHYDDGKNGYRKIKIYPDGSKKRKSFWMNRLVWIAFYGPIPEGLEIDHIDGERANNNLLNFRSPVTKKENAAFKKQREANFLFNRKARTQKAETLWANT